MKIIHVIGYYPPHMGGMELRTKDLSKNIAKRGHKVIVLTSDINCKTGSVNPTKNLKVHYLKSFEFAHTPIMPSLFIKLLSIPKDSVVHLHISQAYLPEITFLVCKLRGIPYLVHIHLDVEVTGRLGFLLPLYKKLLSAPIIRNANVVTVLTKDYKKLMTKSYHVPGYKIEVIPNGTYFKAGKNPKTKIHKPVRILFVGRLSAQKDIPLLVNSISICIKKYNMPLRLTMAGDGEKKKETIQMIKDLKIDKYVTMPGMVEPKNLQKLYRSSDIFVLSSKSEAFPSVMLEAMASGTPVIAVNILSVRNIIKSGYNGLLVKNNPDDIAKAIKKLADNPSLYKKLIKNGLRDAKKYDWKTVTDQYEKVYRKIFRRKNK